eukprot:CAMPEP_0184297734 /NCGR_PEP_ID=MMETSP1049-20130417/8616_1 /TAXON_ID=77928 /ORGANISM="Proteomonas sulcata, Strain CCMP704" /LENGTH=231 /DNA_ID=CAMNT_0026607595 /DNA_START=41 /DNA_END=736 /DNA_ORIENTATION=-
MSSSHPKAAEFDPQSGVFKKSKALEDLEKLERDLKVTRKPKGSSMSVVQGSYHDLMRGRYQYLNDFMEDMQKDPEELQTMTKRQEKRLQAKLTAQASSTKYIVGSFVGGTLLCVGTWYAGWLYTKSHLGVKDGKEYADKMRELTPNTKDSLDQGWVGRSMRDFKLWFRQHFMGEEQGFHRLQKTMRRNFDDMQDTIKRRPSGGIEARAFRTRPSGTVVPVAVSEAVDKHTK